MNESPNSDDSVPSLSSYPPAFVSLITTFIKRAEEAETRAHKALVILKAKDEQVVQLQQRMEVLEKIACRLEEVMVPPLDLPMSPMSFDELNGPHPRDVYDKSNPPLETLYARSNKAPQEKENLRNQDPHNCYEKCQYLIDGLERSNCQLREALAAESQQRVKDHEQYVATLAKVTQAFKDLQRKNDGQNQDIKDGHCSGETHDVSDEAQPVISATGDTVETTVNKIYSNKNYHTLSKGLVNVDSNEDFKKDVGLAESIISVLQCKLQKNQNRNNVKIIKLKHKKTEKSLHNILPKRSFSSQHTPKSFSSLKLKRVHISSHCFLHAIKKQNKKLKNKYHYVCEKFTESLTLCEKLKNDLIYLSNKNKKDQISKVNQFSQFTQTEDVFTQASLGCQREKAYSSRSNNILQGRLDAAAKVMAKQCKQIQDLQKQLGESLGQVDSLRKRLSRAEASAAGKETLGEAIKKQLEDSDRKNLVLTQELQQIKELCSRLRQELAFKTEECTKIKAEKEICETEFIEMKMSLETKLLALSSALQQKEEFKDQMTNELQNKLSNLREQFIAQVTEASDRLVAADFKIQELYLGIETFLKLLFTLNSPELSPSSQAQAVQVASDILQLPPIEVQTILHSSRCDLRVTRWIRECNRMVHEKVFAKNLGNLLLDAVLEAKIT